MPENTQRAEYAPWSVSMAMNCFAVLIFCIMMIVFWYVAGVRVVIRLPKKEYIIRVQSRNCPCGETKGKRTDKTQNGRGTSIGIEGWCRCAGWIRTSTATDL
jgi:hypothetical protein